MNKEWESLFLPEQYTGLCEYKSSNFPNNKFVFRNCKFENQINNGAIRITNAYSTTIAVLENVIFSNCSCAGMNGGSFYYDREGQCIQNKIYYYKSKSNQFSASCRVTCSSISNYLNHFNLSSASSCGIDEKICTTNIGLFSGNITISNVNATNNRLYNWPTIGLGTGAADAVSIFCNLRENYMNDYCFGSGAGDPVPKTILKLSNVIKNTKAATEWGFLYSEFSSVIENCSIMNNEGSPIFSVKDSHHMMTVINCCYDSSSTTGAIVFQSSQTSSFIVDFDLLYTDFAADIGSQCLKMQVKMNFHCTCIQEDDVYFRDYNAIVMNIIFLADASE